MTTRATKPNAVWYGGTDVVGAEALDDPEHEPADHGAADTAESTDDHDDERAEQHLVGHVGRDLKRRGVGDRAHPGEQAGDQERQGVLLLDRDAEHGRGFAVLGHGAHGATE